MWTISILCISLMCDFYVPQDTREFVTYNQCVKAIQVSGNTNAWYPKVGAYAFNCRKTTDRMRQPPAVR